MVCWFEWFFFWHFKNRNGHTSYCSQLALKNQKKKKKKKPIGSDRGVSLRFGRRPRVFCFLFLYFFFGFFFWGGGGPPLWWPWTWLPPLPWRPTTCSSYVFDFDDPARRWLAAGRNKRNERNSTYSEPQRGNTKLKKNKKKKQCRPLTSSDIVEVCFVTYKKNQKPKKKPKRMRENLERVTEATEWSRSDPKKKKIYKKTGAKLKKKKTTNWTQRNEWNDELFRLSPSTLLPIESHRRRPL